MKLLSPVNSFESARLQIENGASEIYLGLDFDELNNISLSGRGRFTSDKRRILVVIDEYRQIVKLARQSGVTLCFAGNLQFLTSELESMYRWYIKTAYEIGFDMLIVGDLLGMELAKEECPGIPLVASSYFNITNAMSVRFFRELGFSRVILSEHLTIEEIADIISTDNDMEYEVFVGFGCANYNGLCYFAHNAGEQLPVGRVCGMNFVSGLRSGSVLDNATDCALCAVPALKGIHVHSLKIVGREMDPVFVSKITCMYSMAIQGIELDAILKVCPEWKKNFCGHKLCKYNRGETGSAVQKAY